jgi:hypothetical protein
MHNSEDRRRHTRFDMSKVPCDLWLISAGAQGSRLERCTLLNLSFGGMCFTFPRSLEQQHTYPFQLKLSDLDPEPFSVQAEIRWSRDGESPGCMMGAEFRESTKGWVGPDELMD